MLVYSPVLIYQYIFSSVLFLKTTRVNNFCWGFTFFSSLPLANDVGPKMSEVTEGKSPVPVLTEGRSPVPVLTEGKSPVPSRAVEAICYKLLFIYLLCPIIEASSRPHSKRYFNISRTLQVLLSSDSCPFCKPSRQRPPDWIVGVHVARLHPANAFLCISMPTTCGLQVDSWIS